MRPLVDVDLIVIHKHVSVSHQTTIASHWYVRFDSGCEYNSFHNLLLAPGSLEARADRQIHSRSIRYIRRLMHLPINGFNPVKFVVSGVTLLNR